MPHTVEGNVEVKMWLTMCRAVLLHVVIAVRRNAVNSLDTSICSLSLSGVAHSY